MRNPNSSKNLETLIRTPLLVCLWPSKCELIMAKSEFVPYDIGNPVKPPLLTPNFDPEANIFFIQNAVNGLFLCTGVSGKDYVCNPTINQFSWLPVRDIDSYLLGMSIAFDPSVSLHYKIAYVYCLKERIFEIRIYSSETRTCKTACIVNLDYNISDIETEFKGGVYWNNAVHWISDNRFVLYFNFDRELVNKISTPSVRKNGNYIFESRGHFLDVEMSHPIDSVLKIHELKRDYSEWFVKYIVDFRELGRSFPRLFRRGSPITLQTAILDLVLGEKEEDSFLVVEIPWTVELKIEMYASDRKLIELEDMRERDRVDLFISMRKQPSDDDMKDWNVNMCNYFKQRWKMVVHKGKDQVYTGIEEEDDVITETNVMIRPCYRLYRIVAPLQACAYSLRSRREELEVF
ncbi:F-box protein-like protein [Tanacetum coccineum]